MLAFFLVPLFRRLHLFVENYRGWPVVRPLGVVLPIAISAGLLTTLGLAHPAGVDPAVFVGVAWGFALMGIVDDALGDRSVGGLAGHLAALRQGRLTTGSVKAVIGPLLGFWAALRLGMEGAPAVLGALLIAVAANFFNLLDTRPGRALKVFIAAASVGFAFSVGAGSWRIWAAIVPPVLVLLLLDLREAGMIGDTGSNVLGGLIGLTFVINFSWPAQLGILVVLAAATIASEKWSFSAAIEGVPVLKWLDELGRRSRLEPMGGTRKG